MYKNCLGYYLDNYDTLLPTDTQLGAVAETLWYQYIKGKFNDRIWADFYDRELFCNHKFPSHDPATTYQNIITTIRIRLITKLRIYERMFNAFMADYNPLWNVDGVTGRITESTHTGTDNVNHLGTESHTLSNSGNNTQTGNKTNVRTGSDTNVRTGTDTNLRTGSESNVKSGTDTTTHSKTTFDSASFKETDKDATTYGGTDTHTITSLQDQRTYGNLQDQHTYNNLTDTETYNSIKDTFSSSGTDSLTRNLSQNETKNLKDKDLEMIIRQGNIGVTKSSELLLDTLALYDDLLMDFVHYVVNDCINQVSYAVY